MNRLRSLIPVLFFPLVVAGCGSSSGGMVDAALAPDLTVDPLLGTWFAQITPIAADNQTATWTFNANGSYAFTHTQVNSPMAASQAGCKVTTDEGGTFTKGPGGGMPTLSVTPGAAGQVVTTGCVNPADNKSAPGGNFLKAGTVYSYSISGNMMTFRDPNAGDAIVFVRK